MSLGTARALVRRNSFGTNERLGDGEIPDIVLTALILPLILVCSAAKYNVLG